MAEYAIVTGGSNGIGRAARHRLEAEGIRVFNLDVAAPEPGGPGLFHPVDLLDEAETAAALEAICSQHEVTRLVNNAGLSIAKPVEETTPEDLARAAALHMIAPLQCVNAVLPAMKRAGFGRIVNVSSRTVTGRAFRTAYGMTKGGLLAMTRSWALELAPFGITVNAVGPGPIDTALFRNGNNLASPEAQRNLRAVAMGRFGTPEEVAQAIAFFLDARTSYVTG
ncbi:MAG TPA: SDR family oxidoreductase, partial [Acetobacteraceae bacterium]|nr:SDR family oxidoreductase [Acetobacteraceae bacterium]